MTLLLDSRVGSRELYGPLVGCCSHTIHLTTLVSGDAAWLGQGPDDLPVSVCVERKVISDLIASKDSGRLAGTQLVNMANHYEYAYLLVEGLWQPDDQGLLCTWRGKRKGLQPLAYGARQHTVKEVYAFLNTLAAKCGIMLWRTANLTESAHWVAAMYGWWHTPWDKHKSHRQKAAVGARLQLSGTRQSRLCRMLQELDGVGLDRAEAIAQEYGTMARLLDTGTPDAVAVIPYGKRKDGVVLHIGRGTAESIFRQLCDD